MKFRVSFIGKLKAHLHVDPLVTPLGSWMADVTEFVWTSKARDTATVGVRQFLLASFVVLWVTRVQVHPVLRPSVLAIPIHVLSVCLLSFGFFLSQLPPFPIGAQFVVHPSCAGTEKGQRKQRALLLHASLDLHASFIIHAFYNL